MGLRLGIAHLGQALRLRWIVIGIVFGIRIENCMNLKDWDKFGTGIRNQD